MACKPYNNSAKLPACEAFRKSPYEEGVWFISDTTWHVGKRYTLNKLLGSGSFSSVCLATDNQTGDKVALKRIPNVLGDLDQARRVLREVCILRRLHHPNIITLKDAFATPAETGPCKLIKGKLVNVSLDLYLALEYADGGDLFDLKGQLTETDVRWVMWQILAAVKYLHDREVWHRDLKSANIMINWEAGTRAIKIGDFGSARSAYRMLRPVRQCSLDGMAVDGGGATAGVGACAGGSRQNLVQSDSFARDMEDEMHIQTVPSRLKLKEPTSTYSRPLTRVVATPCYRAPEVVMSRGGYTSAIDMWSIGCIFGELLHRISRPGSAATPNLRVAPLFAVEGHLPKTPSEGDWFPAGPGCDRTRRELQALFSVIGTPAWACVDSVQIAAWRHYLRKLPGKAPSLFRRFGKAGEPAVDLLQRLLAFDPARRCSAEEALAHEYLSDMAEELARADSDAAALADAIDERSNSATTPRSHGGTPPHGATASSAMLPPGGTAMRAAASLAPSSEPQHAAGPPAAGVDDGGGAVIGGGATCSSSSGVDRVDKPGAGGAAGDEAADGMEVDKAGMEVDGAGDKVGPARQPGAEAGGDGEDGMQLEPTSSTLRRHYYEEKNPARALALLEEEMARISERFEGSPQDACEALKELLEREVREVQEMHRIAAAAAATTCQVQHPGGPASPARPPVGSPHRAGKPPRPPHALEGHGSGLARILSERRRSSESLKLQLDKGALECCVHELAPERLGNVADAMAGTLDPEKYLGPKRHGEWTATSGSGTRAGPQWGVSVIPPGIDGKTDPKVMDIIKGQQTR